MNLATTIAHVSARVSRDGEGTMILACLKELSRIASSVDTRAEGSADVVLRRSIELHSTIQLAAKDHQNADGRRVKRFVYRAHQVQFGGLRLKLHGEEIELRLFATRLLLQ